MRTVRPLLAAFALLVANAASAQDPVSLERTLVRAAPAVLKHCKEKGYKNVGVLKFLVHKGGDAKITDSAGTLNRTVARQLEMGLILANSATDPVGIIDDASDVAAKTPGANHLTKDGRLKLFDAKYPLAWGKETVAPDAFVTGIVGVSADLKTLTVKLLSFDKATNKLDPLGADLVALNDPRKLSEIGESFTRGAFDDGSVETKADPKEKAKQEEQVIAKAAEVKTQAAKNPAADAAAPVALEILYDGKVVPIEVRDGKAFAPEALEGQKVTLRIKRNGGAGTLGCVVKVNGENTLFREKQPDLGCRKWLLFDADKDGVAIEGYQKSETAFEEFRVLSRAESKARELDYGSDVGTITLTVFGERKGKAPGAADLSDEAQNTKVVEKAKLPEKKPDNFNALTAQLLDDADRSTGGLIAQGAEKKGDITIVKFTSDPTPLMSLVVTYYKK